MSLLLLASVVAIIQGMLFTYHLATHHRGVELGNEDRGGAMAEGGGEEGRGGVGTGS